MKFKDPDIELEQMKNAFIEALNPLKIYLFGSYAYGTPNEDSDFDFYIVVDDSVKDMVMTCAEAYGSLRDMDRRPVDIIVNRESRFKERKHLPTLERIVYEKGKLLYDSKS